MKRRLLSFLMIVVLLGSALPMAALAAQSMSNFAQVKTYSPGQFTDVTNQWFASDVRAAYELGLINGKTPNTYAPSSNLTIAEAIKLAACLSSIYKTGTSNFTNGSPWYRPYVDYALTNGIIAAEYKNYNTYATRSDFAQIFAKALPDEALTPINTIEDNAIPDVSGGHIYGPAVYKLYRAGVLTGSDSVGTFYPNRSISRDAVAAIAARMASPELRRSLTLSVKSYSAQEIAEEFSSAVFYIDLLSKAGTSIGSGSGFFISSDGIAVTNFHVIEDITSARVRTTDGKTYDIAGVYDYSVANDLALIQIDGTGFNHLALGDSDSMVTGDTVYAIGYPNGVGPTITSGTITNDSHIESGIENFMLNAAIAPGSSGGALISSYGKVVGVTTAAYTAGQNLNLAAPINTINNFSMDSCVPLSTVFAREVTYYELYPVIPDFGAFAGLGVQNDLLLTQAGDLIHMYYYDTEGVSGDINDVLDDYTYLLWLEGFTYRGYDDSGAYTFHFFADPSKTYGVLIGLDEDSTAVIGIMSYSLLASVT